MVDYQEFTNDVCVEIGYYVYRLIDPRNGETFYVGKGKNNRIFEHLKGKAVFDKISDKIKRINEIHNVGLKCILVIHRHGLSEQEAFHVESALIDAYPQLTNEVGGYGCTQFGVMTVNDIIGKYALEEIPEVDFNRHQVLIIKVGKSLKDGLDLYNATRYAWRINVKKASQADYVLSVDSGGIIRQVFIANEWLVANSENFPEFAEHHSERHGFVGVVANNVEIIDLYKNKKVPSKYLKIGIASPIQYNF